MRVRLDYVLVLIAVFLLVFALAAGFNALRCEQVGQVTGTPVQYRIGLGCFMEMPDGQLIPVPME